MRILFYTLIYLPDLEAASRRMSGLASNLANLGNSVDVVCGYPERINNKKRKYWFFQFFRKRKIDDVNVYNYYTIPYNRKGNIRRLLNNFSFAFSSLWHLLCLRKYDIVFVTSPPLYISGFARFIAKVKHAKLVFDVRDIWPDIAIEMGYMHEGSFMYKTFHKLAKKMYKSASLITTVSEMKVLKLQKQLFNYQDKIKLISNGVDPFFKDLEDDLDFLNEFQFDKFFSTIYVGNIGKAQDLDSFLWLAKKHLNDKNMRFFLIGEGVELARIMKIIAEDGLTNVIYVGKRNMNEVKTAYKYASLAYVSLINANLLDSVPTKLYEALFCGCPVLLSAMGESVDVLKTANLGKAITPGDFAGLCSSFCDIYEHYDEIIKNKEKAITYINSNFNRVEISKKLNEELHNILRREKI